MRAALYARVSTVDKGQDPEVQLMQLRDLVARKGWTIQDEYVDHTSGTKEIRPALSELMDAVAAGKVDVVMVYRFDRWGRSVQQLLHSLDQFRQLGVEFVSSSEAMDTTTPAGRLLFTVIAAMAEFERNIIRERVLAGMETARRRGQKFGRPRDAIDVRRATALLDSGMELRDVATALETSRRTLRRRLVDAGEWPRD